MREILFRGKRIGDNRWVEGGIMRKFHPNFPHESERDFYFQKENCYVICANNRDIFVAQNTIGQFTGLTDKNGKKIFEVDIIRANHDGAVGVVRFGEYMSPSDPDPTRHIGYYVDWQGKEKDFLRADLGYWASRSDVEVVGNIHDDFELFDNPELLEDKL